MKKILKWVGITLAALYVFGLVLIVFDIGEETKSPDKQQQEPQKSEPKPKPEPKRESHEADEQEALSTAAARERRAEPKEDPLSSTEHLARSVAQEFRIARSSEGVLSSDAERVTGFADDTDDLDRSIEVNTDIDPDEDDAEAIAERVGDDVLYVSETMRICKVDVMGTDGERIVERTTGDHGCTTVLGIPLGV